MAIAYVSGQSGNAVEGAATLISTFAATVGTAVSTGNTVLIMIGMSPQFGAVTNFQISDNAVGSPNTYTATVRNIDGGGGGYVAFYCESVSGSPTQFNMFDSGGQQFGWAVMSVDTFSGVASLDSVTATNSQNGPGTGTDVITTGSFTPTASGETVWCGMVSWPPGNAHGTNYTTGQSNDSTFLCIDTEYRLAAPGGAQAATFTNSTNGGTSGDYFDTAAILLVPASSGGTTYTFGPQDWKWQGNAPIVSMSFLFANKAWHWSGNAPVISSAFTFANKAWHWAANAPTISSTFSFANKAWDWVDNGFSLTFTTSLAFQKAWAWTARRAIFSGGNFPSIKGWNVIRPVIWSVLRGEFIRPRMGPDQ